MDKSEDLSKNIQNIKSLEKIEDYTTDHNTHTHTHSNGQFPLATKT